MDRAVARESRIPTQTGRVSGSTLTKKKKMWRIWAGACFAIALLVVFSQPLLALINYAAGSDLYSYILLIPLVSAYLLYVRRNQLPKDYVVDLPLRDGVPRRRCRFLRVHVLVAFRRTASAKADYLTLQTLSFLCCLAAGGFFFFGRAWMQAAAFPLAYLIFMVPMPDSMRDALELASKNASAEVANFLFRLSNVPFLRAGRRVPTAEHHDRSCAGMQRYSIELGAVDDQHSCRQSISEDVVAANRAGFVCHSPRHFTEWLSHPRDWAPLR